MPYLKLVPLIRFCDYETQTFPSYVKSQFAACKQRWLCLVWVLSRQLENWNSRKRGKGQFADMWNLRRPFLFPHKQYNNLWNQIISTHHMDRRCYEKRNTKVFVRTASASASWNVSTRCGSSSSRRKADQQKVFHWQRQLYYSAIIALIPICRVKPARESCFWQLFVMM